MSDARHDLLRLLEDLGRQRDELRMQLYAGKAEARVEWQRLEHRWAVLKPRLKSAAAEGANGSGSAHACAALRLAAEEIGNAYRRIRSRLT